MRLIRGLTVYRNERPSTGESAFTGANSAIGSKTEQNRCARIQGRLGIGSESAARIGRFSGLRCVRPLRGIAAAGAAAVASRHPAAACDAWRDPLLAAFVKRPKIIFPAVV